MLLSINPNELITDEIIMSRLQQIDDNLGVYTKYVKFVGKLQKSVGKTLTTEEVKQSKSFFYASIYSN